MAVELDTGVPWIMCKQDDAPDPVVCFIFSSYFYHKIIGKLFYFLRSIVSRNLTSCQVFAPLIFKYVCV